MNNFIYLAAVSMTVVGSFLPAAVNAQSIFIQGFPSVETTTTIDRLDSPISPIHNSVTTSTTTIYPGGSYSTFHRRQPQPTIILQQQNIYPRAVQSTCTTSIIGSPIPSPIALNSSTGQPCR